MLNIALFGPPGAGKGTQSEFLVKEFNLFYISTGDLLRKEIAAETRLGLEARSIIASGGLVSDEIIVQVIEKTITEHPEANGFLFDGFPRTYIQCYILEGLMMKLNTSLNCLVSLEVDEETSVRRLLERGRTSGRTDDNETVIRNRLREYSEKTLPVLDFYREKGNYQRANGNQAIEKVTTDIRVVVRNELAKYLVNVVVFGYPGSGRGSQGAALARKYGLEYVATGPMLDEEIKARTPLGQRIIGLYESGQLVPDEIVVQLIEKKLERSSGVKGFIFKGFPRTLVQSYILDGLLRKRGSSICPQHRDRGAHAGADQAPGRAQPYRPLHALRQRDRQDRAEAGRARDQDGAGHQQVQPAPRGGEGGRHGELRGGLRAHVGCPREHLPQRVGRSLASSFRPGRRAAPRHSHGPRGAVRPPRRRPRRLLPRARGHSG